MKILPELALTYDDVLLVPQYSEVSSRRTLSTATQFTTGINLAASLHFSVALKNAFILEYCVSPSPMRRSLTKQTFEAVDGIVKVPEEPGLGVDLDEDALEKYRIS